MTTDIDAIRQRANAATPGPWTMRDGWGPSGQGVMRFRRIANSTHDGVIEATRDGELAAMQADAEFIAHARKDIPALLVAFEEARDAAERLLRMEREHTGSGREGHLSERDLAPLLHALQIDPEEQP